MRGVVSRVTPILRNERLKVVAKVAVEKGSECEAYMPDREISAILPRTILLGEASKAPPAMLDTIRPILRRMTGGRRVRLWQYNNRFFFSFLPWKSVRFARGR